MKARSILVAEVNENKTQCDCFVTNHILRERSEPKEVTNVSEDGVFTKDVRSRRFILQTRSVNVKEILADGRFVEYILIDSDKSGFVRSGVERAHTKAYGAA